MGKILDDANGLQGSTTGPGCAVGGVMMQMPPDDRKDTQAMLSSPTLFGTTIRKALALHGYAVGEQAVSRHRSGECTCAKRYPELFV